MEKRLNAQLEAYLIQFKDNIKKKITELGFQDKSKTNELLEFVYDYKRLTLTKDDFAKRKRIQNAIPVENRCSAKKSCSEQCTRRRKEGSEYCGTHSKNTPNGVAEPEETAETIKKMEVIVKEINGIVYYVDQYKNVYRTEDILNNKENPQIIAKYEVLGIDRCVIREFSV